MAHKIQVKRGNKANLPTLDVGEFGLCQDTNELFIGNSGNQKIFPPTAPTISDVEGLQTALDGKVDDSQVLTNVPANAKFTDTVTTINGKTGAIAKADITALGIPAQDTVYTHPATHSADMIVDGTTNKAYTATEKTKLAGIATGANNYTHPATAGNKHIPSGGTTGQMLVYGGSSGTATWGDAPSATVTAEDVTLPTSTADLYGLTGDDANVDVALMKAVPFRAYGNVIFTDTIAAGSTLTKNIAIGSGKMLGHCAIYNASQDVSRSLFANFNTSNLQTIVHTSYSSGNYRHPAFFSRRTFGQITKYVGPTGTVGDQAAGHYQIDIMEIYIDGTNLRIDFKNTAASPQALNCYIEWMVR